MISINGLGAISPHMPEQVNINLTRLLLGCTTTAESQKLGTSDNRQVDKRESRRREFRTRVILEFHVMLMTSRSFAI